MKITFKLVTLLSGVILLISLGTAAAQWSPGTSTSTPVLNDTIVVNPSSGSAEISGTFTSSDPISKYVANFAGPAHYYQVQTPTLITGTTTTFTITDNSLVYPFFTILDSSLNILLGSGTTYIGRYTNTYTVQSGSTYYIEATYNNVNNSKQDVPFNFTIDGNVAALIQVSNSTSGFFIGVPSIAGSLAGSDAQSHQRPGCYADYYQVTGASATTITMQGFDTYLYLYSYDGINAQLVAKNDDSNPPGHGGSRIYSILTTGTMFIEATSYVKNKTGNYTLSTSAGGLIQIPNPWDPTVSGSNTSAVPMAYTCTNRLSSDSMSHIRKGSYSNYYLMAATSSGATTISTTGNIGLAPVDTYLYLYDQTGNVIGSNDDHTPPGNGGALISANLTAGNNYYIEVTTYRPAKAGTYTLTVSSKTGGAAGSVAPAAYPF